MDPHSPPSPGSGAGRRRSGSRLRERWNANLNGPAPGLAGALEALYEGADLDVIAPDPLELVLRYGDPHDQEVAGLFASAWAYGRADQTVKQAGLALGLMGESPAAFVDAVAGGEASGLGVFRSVVHRFHRGGDWASLCWFAGDLRAEFGSLGRAVSDWWAESDCDLRLTLNALSRAYRSGAYYDRIAGVDPGLDFGDQAHLMPDPLKGSACKRLNLWLRWMVRMDAVDPGPWRHLSPEGPGPADLIIPLDTHIARLGRYLGLTVYSSPGWAMAREVTASLARFDPSDPVKYDFALCRLGVLDLCPRRRDGNICAECPILAWCRL